MPDRHIRVARAVTIPDPVRLERFRHAPELGARLLFFTGGTALRGLSRKLVEYTHHSTHIITPFDSGGSSAKLRKAFRMPAVGDMRNRLMALADQSVLGNPEIYSLFAYRFPQEAEPAALSKRLAQMVRGVDSEVKDIPEPMRSIVRRHLGFFRDAMPKSFDLRGACIGNLVLAGGYLNQGRKLDSVLYLFSQLVEVRGVVRPVVDKDLHLVARLTNGQEIVGQHLLTGKEAPAIESPIEHLYLGRSRRTSTPVEPEIPERVERLIRSAELICYPIGSFYTSLIATLLPKGVSDAIRATDVPKVYVPNPGHDPEEIGLDLSGKIERLVYYLKRGASKRTPTDRLLQFVLVDSGSAGMKRAMRKSIERLGVEVIDTPLTTAASAPYYDDQLLAEALLSLV